MINYEYLTNKNIVKTGLASAVAAIALTGCAGFGNNSGDKQAKIPNCDQTLTNPELVKNQVGVIQAYEEAGQRLITDYRELKSQPSQHKRVQISVAVSQLFDLSSSGGGGLINIHPTTTGSKILGPDSYLADDPAELLCKTKDVDGNVRLALSTQAEQARIILRDAGDSVVGLARLTN